MQRAEMEELRQREANLTALQAIGPRKKPRLDGAGQSDVSLFILIFFVKLVQKRRGSLVYLYLINGEQLLLCPTGHQSFTNFIFKLGTL